MKYKGTYFVRTFDADLGFPGGSDSKESAWNTGDHTMDPQVGKIPWRRKWQPTTVFFPGKSHGWRSLVGCSPWGHKESHMTEQLTLSLFFDVERWGTWVGGGLLLILL